MELQQLEVAFYGGTFVYYFFFELRRWKKHIPLTKVAKLKIATSADAII